jgi:hypothetical protein
MPQNPMSQNPMSQNPMSQLDPSALTARNRLLAMFVVLTLLDGLLVILSRDKWAIARILVTIVVMYFVLQGQKWAKWCLVSLYSLVTVLLLAMVVALSSKLSTVLIVGSLILATLSVIVLIYMVSSRDLHRYFSWKRQC